MPQRRIALALLALAGVSAVVLAVPGSSAPSSATVDFTAATPPQQKGLPDLDRIDPVRFAYDDAVVEHAQVTSRDGINQIWVDIVRPQTAEKVPAIMMSSPYFNSLGRGFKAECKTPHQSPPGGLPGSPGTPVLGCTSETPFPEWYDEYFVPRGYAFVAMDLRGSRNTSGCQTYGDRDEVFDAVDVIDWIAEQPWSNGKVGMTGGSYDGTIANGAAVEAPISGKHPDALGAIIPIRAIDRWYDYHYFNGVMSEGHAATPALFTAVIAGGDLQNSGTDDLLYPLHVAERKACIATFGLLVDAGYAQPYQDADSAFWSERDFAKDAAGIKAAVFVMHGLYDFNVKPLNAGHLWAALPKDTPKKLWWFNGDHVDPRAPDEETAAASGHLEPFPFADRFIEWNHRWWLQFLKGVEAGALSTPPVETQQRDGSWLGTPAYPAAGTPQVLSTTSDGLLVAGPVAEEPATVTWDDSPAGNAGPTRAAFTTAPFAQTTRLSGQFVFDLQLSATGPDTTVAVQVDDLPPATAVDQFTDYDSLDDATADGPFTVSYGWLRAFYRDSVSAAGRPVPSGGAPLQPGTVAALQFPSLHTDFVVAAGHRLRFSFSNAAGGTVPSLTGQAVSLTVGSGGSTITLPVAAAGSAAPAPVTPPAPPVAPAPTAPRPPLAATGMDLPLALATLALLTGVAVRRRLGRG